MGWLLRGEEAVATPFFFEMLAADYSGAMGLGEKRLLGGTCLPVSPGSHDRRIEGCGLRSSYIVIRIVIYDHGSQPRKGRSQLGSFPCPGLKERPRFTIL